MFRRRLFVQSKEKSEDLQHTGSAVSYERTQILPKCHYVVLLLLCGSGALFVIWNRHHFRSPDNSMTRGLNNKSSSCPSLMQGKGVPTFKTRMDLPKLLDNEPGFHRGIELGVQSGKYSYWTLTQWTNCTEYHLVDLWGHQENYEDVANVDQAKQEKLYQNTLRDLKEYKEKLHVCRNFTSVCVKSYEDEYFDYIYVDARHDFKGVWEDLVAYWPKLKVGGIMAGHDYVTNDDGPLPNQDWSKNYDGTIDETGTVVKGAVDKFAASVCRQVTVGYRESGWNTWAMRK